MDVQGHCDDRFTGVADEFERNFAERGELGASVAVTVGGETVVDLWGGHADPEHNRTWDKDTVCVAMSSTKGVTALAAHVLASDGGLDVDEPVATYWPEFAAAGKERVLVRHLLTHQAGLPALRDPVPPGGFYDWDDMIGRLAAEPPFWEPGTRHGYHALTFGFLVGEVVRRVTGRSFGRFVADEIAGPLGLDLYIGLPEGLGPRVARLVPPPDPDPGDPIPRFLLQAITEPGSIPWLVMQNNGGYLVPGEWDSPAALAAELPASGAVLYGPGRWTLGFLKAGYTPRGVEPPSVISLAEEAFGHTGQGGSIGFGDPVCEMSFGYVMNQMSAAMGLGPTGQSLVDATYRALGYRRIKYHSWVR